LCPIVCYEFSGALFLAKVPDGTPELTFNVLWAHERGTQICILFFLSKVPVNETLQLFTVYLKFLIKIPLSKEIYPFSERPQGSVPPCSPKAGTLWRQDVRFQCPT
jgi:hypothetical protein